MISLIILLVAVSPAAHAYVLEGEHWPSNKPVVLDLQLGSPGQPLLDGSTSWDQVAEEAMAIWNTYLGSGVKLSFVTTDRTPASHDGVNSVFFSDKVYGESFGDDTLAITLSFFNTHTHIKSEADVLFNRAKTFDSYRGPLRYRVYDLRRTALHEFGHVLGLAHTAQTVQSIMTPVVTNIERLQPDDIAGIASIYGPTDSLPIVDSLPTADASVDVAFTYQITALGSPTSFGASGLPPGLSVDASTGLITGTPGTEGIYPVVLSAINANGTAFGTLILTVASPPTVAQLLHATAVLGQPFSYQIAADHRPTKYTAYELPDGLSLDPATGLLSGTPTVVGDFSASLRVENAAGFVQSTLDLQVYFDRAITILHTFYQSLDGEYPSGLILATDGNFYGTTSAGGQYSYGTIFQLTPDGRLTTIHHFNHADGYEPTGLIQASDGNLYGTTYLGGPAEWGTVFRCTLDGTVTTLHGLDVGGPFNPTRPLIQGADGNLYGTVSQGARVGNSEGGAVFKITLDGTLTILQALPYAHDGPSAVVQGVDGSLYVALPGDGFTGGRPAQLYKGAADGTFTVLCSLPGSKDGLPSDLLLARDGNFYGSIQEPNYSYPENLPGLLYKCTPDGVVTILHTFDATDDSTHRPSALIQGQDGNFYGTASGGYFSARTPAARLFEMTPDGAVTVLHSFTSDEGYGPGKLVQAADGSFYGSASTQDSGILFNTHPAGTFAAAGPPPVVTLATTTPEVAVGSGGHAVLTLTLSAAQSTDLTVHYTVKGSGINGKDYAELSGRKKIKAGRIRKVIKIVPQGNLGGAVKKMVKVTLAADPAYTVGTAKPVKVRLVAGP